MGNSSHRVVVVDPCDATREMVALRLRAQSYVVDCVADAATAADMSLRSPPAAVVADLWMPGISGVQLCRLLRCEPATADVGIILCGDADDGRNRFWAERAGAQAYVPKRRTGELVRALARTIVPPAGDGFFLQLGGGAGDIRDRIARHLDAALFDSVIAAEVRALATCDAFDRLFDLFVQFLAQVSRYRWVAVSTDSPPRFALHHHPDAHDVAEREARAALEIPDDVPLLRIEDEDAAPFAASSPPIVRAIPFGNERLGRIALSAGSAVDAELEVTATLLSLVARELGGPLRIASLVEESQRLAATDALTGLMNRRAFSSAIEREIARAVRHAYPLSVALIDVDHFKLVNDRRGHRVGDRVLAALGALLRGSAVRQTDMPARWGGEEFVLAYPSTEIAGAKIAAERLRQAVERLVVLDDAGEPVPLTISIGLAELRQGEALENLVDRADRAMYASKTAGRNRVSVNQDEEPKTERRSLGPAPARTD